MRSQRTLRHWIQQLLPDALPGAHQAAQRLLSACWLTGSVELSALARVLDGPTTAKVSRQYLARWLGHPAWEPLALYGQLTRVVRRHLRRQQEVLLLIDLTSLGQGWNVLQVSVPWQHRALPLLRLVHPYHGASAGQTALVLAALTWLAAHLPGPRRKYVIVWDRGFASVALLRQVQAHGFRFVGRVKHNWNVRGAAG